MFSFPDISSDGLQYRTPQSIPIVPQTFIFEGNRSIIKGATFGIYFLDSDTIPFALSASHSSNQQLELPHVTSSTPALAYWKLLELIAWGDFWDLFSG
jgi:hypothetical protein